MSDKYQKAVEYLTQHPEEIGQAWVCPARHPAGCLFAFVSPSGCDYENEKFCGCLTQVKAHHEKAFTPRLTKAIRADPRIPANWESIKVKDLPVFAEWQARIDRELRCKKPTLA